MAAGTAEPLLGARHSACEDSVLLLSETLTNAIVHGGGDLVEVDAYVGTANIRIEVTDEGGDSVPHHVDDPHGEHGRGLPILAMLAKSWGSSSWTTGGCGSGSRSRTPAAPRPSGPRPATTGRAARPRPVARHGALADR